MPQRHYRITMLPTSDDLVLQAQVGGDVMPVMTAAFAQTIRLLADRDDPQASLTLAYRYQRQRHNDELILSIHLGIQGKHADTVQMLDTALTKGHVGDLYALEPCRQPPAILQGAEVHCHLHRRFTTLAPLIQADEHPLALDDYPLIWPLRPRPRNGYSTLLQPCRRVAPAMVRMTVAVEPAIERIRQEFASYQLLLRQLERGHWSPQVAGISRFGATAWQARGSDPIEPLVTADHAAGDALRMLHDAQKRLLDTQLSFEMEVVGPSAAEAALLASDVAESAFEGGSFTIAPGSAKRASHRSLEDEQHFDNEPSLTWLFERLRSSASVDELAPLVRFPVASPGPTRMVRLSTAAPPFDPGRMLRLGDEQAAPHMPASGDPQGLPFNGLNTHMSIFGVSGSGKTSQAHAIQLGMFARGIPCCRLDLAKRDGLALKGLRQSTDPLARALAEQLQVYQAGDERFQPLLNLLVRPRTMSIAEAVSSIVDLFRGVIPMEGSLEGILLAAVERAYDQYPCPSHPPTLADVTELVLPAMIDNGYPRETYLTLGGALTSRLHALRSGQAGRLFAGRETVPAIPQLLQNQTYISYAGVSDMVTAAHLLKLFQLIDHHLRHEPLPEREDGGPGLVLLIDEAHKVFGAAGPAEASAENANPKAHAVKALTNMLAEWRSRGVGVIVIDQHPTAVDAAVIKATACKIAFAQSDQEDRERLSGAMMLSDRQAEQLPQLQCGEAICFRVGDRKPRLIKTRDIVSELGINSPPSESALFEMLREEDWFITFVTTRLGHELDELQRLLDAGDRDALAATRRLERLIHRERAVQEMADASQRRAQWPALMRAGLDLQKTLNQRRSRFKAHGPASLLGPDVHGELVTRSLRRRRDEWSARLTRSDEQHNLHQRMLERLINRCRDAN
ncbi:MAG: hypothetical protein WD534_15145 [Phycisphaeraceae bacterium]